jgi:hypothetical protein
MEGKKQHTRRENQEITENERNKEEEIIRKEGQ